jgi:DNA-binding CsgD family transcriptional regulator/tetratricopeptide (TPR) repeat protein
LVGRGAELNEICSLIRERCGVVLAGSAGVGKTRLLDEVAALLAPEGWHIERVAGTPAIAALPLAAFAFLDTPEATDMGGFATPLGSARRSLLQRCGSDPLLLVVDDAHSLDDASATLVYQLAASGEAVVAANVRASVRSPEPIVGLWKNEWCQRLELQALARHELDRLIESVLGGRVDAEARRALWDASQGNLLFLRELVRDGLRSGTLLRRGIWQWDRPQRPPGSVRELIGQQVNALSADARLALELVALTEPLEWDLLTTVTKEAVADALVDEGHLATHRDEHRLVARTAHPLVADVVRAEISETRRRRLFADLVDALPSHASRRNDLLRRVTWLVEADRFVAPDELIEAAQQTMLLDAGRAEALASLARERGGGRPADIVLAQVLMFSNRAEDAEQLLSSVVTPVIEDDIGVTVMRANNLTFGLYDPEQAYAVLDALLTRVPDDARASEVRAQQLPMLLFAGRAHEVLSRSESLLEGSKVEPADRLRALITLIPALATTGRPLEALAAVDHTPSLIVDAQRELPYAPGQVAVGMILSLQWAGRLDDAEAIARLGYEQGITMDADLLRGVSAYELGLCAFWRGRMQTAHERFEEAVAVMRHTDVGFLPSACDHLAATRAHLRLEDEIGSPYWTARFPLYEAERLRLAGAVAACRGDLEGACALTDEAAVSARESGLHMLELFALWDRARYDDARSVVDDVELAASRCEGELAPLLASATRALCGSEANALEDAADGLARLGFLLWAAELGRAAAREFGRAGMLARAARADTRADQLVAGCEGAWTPLSGRRHDHDLPELTRREREIVELAKHGATNAEMARRLSISVRTVETHLQHVYDKLGVNSRQDLAAIFDR